MSSFIEYSTMNKVCEVITDYVANGSFKSLKDNVVYQDIPSHAVLIRLVDYNNNFKEPYVYIDEHAYNFLSKTKLYGGEIIISNVGANAGTVFKVPKLDIPMSLAPNSIMIKTREFDDFYYYWLKSNIGQRAMKNIITSTAQPKFNKTDFKKIQVPVFEIKEQKKIADLLSSLDDKIEINNKINQELEELGQALYTKWFVNFDFPNEDGKPYRSSGGEMVESELGMIPKGWRVGVIGDGNITKIMGSGINKFESTKKYVATADVSISSINSHENITYDKKPSRANMQPKANTVWFAKMKDTKKIMSISDFDLDIIDEYVFSTGFAGIECLNNSIYYIWNFINNKEFESIKDSLSNGSTQQSINKENISKIKLVIPNNNILKLYYELIYDSMKQISLNKRENQKLVELRDFLIPQLMSGNLEIKDIDNTGKEV